MSDVLLTMITASNLGGLDCLETLKLGSRALQIHLLAQSCRSCNRLLRTQSPFGIVTELALHGERIGIYKAAESDISPLYFQFLISPAGCLALVMLELIL